jgi:transposase
VFFVDAAHFVLAAFMSMVWCLTRVWIRAPSGRQRFNVLGALDAVTKEVVTVVNSTYINSLSVCALLEKLATLRPMLPITVVLDNARYQRCALVKTCAEKLKIELLFLPTYSPNLNLIERLWKFVKKQCLYAKYYPNFHSFTTAKPLLPLYYYQRIVTRAASEIFWPSATDRTGLAAERTGCAAANGPVGAHDQQHRWRSATGPARWRT